MPSLLEYSVTRPFTIRHFTLVIVVLGIFWVTFITLVNVADVGYNSATVVSATFNSTQPFWYERVPRLSFWFPNSWSCSPSKIILGQGLSQTRLLYLKLTRSSHHNFRNFRLYIRWIY